MKSKLKSIADSVIQKASTIDIKSEATKAFTNVQALYAGLNQDEIFKWIDGLKFKTSEYDKAMDATYIATKEGGGNHRLFDEGHTLTEAWDRVSEALPDDSFAQEVVGYMKSIWNDVSTVKGLPFETLEKSNYEEWVEKITSAIPGIQKDWFYDMMNFDAVEIAGTGVGAVSAIFMLNKEDQKKFSEIIGAMGISAIIGANPLMGLMVIALTGYSYFVKKNEIDVKLAEKSAALTGMGALIFSLIGILGLPFIIELVLVMVVTNIVRKKVVENDQLLEVFKHQLSRATDAGKSAVLIVLKSVIEKLEPQVPKT